METEYQAGQKVRGETPPDADVRGRCSVKESRTFNTICAASQRRRNGDFYEMVIEVKLRNTV